MSSVLIVGTKLSAIDMALCLCKRSVFVTMISPSGELPAVRVRLYESETKQNYNTEKVFQLIKKNRIDKYNELCGHEKLNIDINHSLPNC